jgi:hypothetical protein
VDRVKTQHAHRAQNESNELVAAWARRAPGSALFLGVFDRGHQEMPRKHARHELH